MTWNVASWAERSEVKAACAKIVERKGLDKSLNQWRDAEILLGLWEYLDKELLRP